MQIKHIHKTAQRRWQLTASVLVAYFLRTFRLGFQELRGDEAFSYVVTRDSVAGIFRLLIEAGEPHPPLHFLLMHGSIQYTGISELSLRYIGVLASVLAVPAAYWIGRNLLGSHARALALMWLMATNPLQIWAAQDARHQYALVAGFSTLATALFVFAVAQRSRKWWFLYAVAAALTMYSHYYGIFPLAAHGVYLLARWRQDGIGLLRSWLLAGVGAAATFAPWLYLHAPGLARRVDEASNPNLLDHVLGVWRELTVASTLPYTAALATIALALVVLGTYQLYQQRPAWTIALWFWLLSTTLMLYIVRLGRALFNDFYIVPASLPWLILLLAGLWWLFEQGRGWLPSGAVLVMLGLIGASLGNYYFSAEYSKSWGYRSVAAYLEEHATAADALVAHSPDPNFEYYFRDTAAHLHVAPPRLGLTPDEVRAYMAQLATDYERMWFIPAHKSPWDPMNVVFDWIDFETIRVHERNHNRLPLLAYRPKSMMNGLTYVIDRQLRDELVLKDVFVTVAGEQVDLSQPIEMAAGERMRINFRWQALRELDQSYTVFVHLLGDDGQLAAQHDGIPVRASRPSNYWQAGDEHWDLHELFLPDTLSADGGTLYVGLYTTDSVERQAFDDGADTWPLAEFVFVEAE